MATHKLVVELSTVDKGVKQSLKNLNQELRQLDKVYKVTNHTMQQQGDAFKTLQNSHQYFAKNLQIVNKKIKTLDDALKNYKKSQTEYIENITKTKESLKGYSESLGIVKKDIKGYAKSLIDLQEENKKYLKTQEQEKTKVQEYSLKLNKLNETIKTHKERLIELRSEKNLNKAEILKEINALKNLNLERKSTIKAIDNHKKAITDYNNKLEENRKKIDLYKTKLQELANQKKILEKYEQGERNNLQRNKNQLNFICKKINEYKNALQLAKAERDNLTQAERQANINYEKSILEKEIKKLERYKEKITHVSEKMQNVGSTISTVGNSLLKITAPIVAFGTYGIKSAIDFESSFTGVKKTVDATDEQFKALESTIIQMSERLPQSSSQIAKIMEIAGQLGVGVNDLEKFTDVMIRLGDSTNIASDEAGLLLAQYSNITGLPHTEIDRLASSIVDLGNHTATTEDKIVNMMHSTAGGSKIFGLADSEIAGLSATMASTGIEAEKGGTAITKFMLSISTAAGKSTDEFKKMGESLGLTLDEINEQSESAKESLTRFGLVTGLTAEEFKKLVRENPADALTSVIEGLGKMKDSGEDILPVLEALGIKEVRLRDTILRLVNGHKNLRKNIELSKKAFKDNIALTQESEKRYATTESKLKILKNQFQNLSMELGTQLLPTVIELMAKGKDLVLWFKNLDSGTKNMLITFTKLVAVSGLVCKGLGGVTKFVASLVGGYGKFKGFLLSKKLLELKEISEQSVTSLNLASKGVSALGTSAKASTLGLGFLSGGLSSLLPLMAGVTAAGAGLYATIKLTNSIESLNKKTVLDNAESYSIWEKVVDTFNGTHRKTNEELARTGYIYSDTSKLSNEFGQSVKLARAELADFNFELERVNLDGVFNIDDENRIDQKISNIITKSINTLESQKGEIQEKWKEIFTTDGNFDEAEKNTLEHLTRQKETIINEVKTLEAEIREIRQKQQAENRDLNSQEIQEIQKKMQRIQQIELESLTKTNEDKLYLQNKFRQEIGKLDLEGISERLTKEKELLDQQTAEKIAWIDTQIQLQQQYAETKTGIEKEQALKSIEQMEETKQKIIDSNKDQYEKLLGIIREKYPELLNEIDINTGKILTTQDKKLNEAFEKWQSYHTNLYTLNKTGWNQVLDETTGVTQMIFQVVDESTGRVIASYDNEKKEIHACTESSKAKLTELMNTTTFTHGQMSAEFLRMTQTLTNSTSLNAGQLHILQSEMGFTKSKTGELIGTIHDLNGTPIKVIVNKDGTISNLEQIRSKIFSIPTSRNVYIGVQYHGYSTGNHPSYASFSNGAFASGTNYLQSFASGTNSIQSFANGGLVRTRVNELGWELFDLPRGTKGYMLGTNRGDDIMDLPLGTKITNHIASTRLMVNEIKKEVARRFNAVHENYKVDQPSEKTLKQDITIKFEKVVIKDERDIKELIKLMQYELKKGVVI